MRTSWNPSTAALGIVFRGLLLVLIAFYTVAVPQGERWFDADGSVCQVAEIRCCEPTHSREFPLQRFLSRIDRFEIFVSDDGCTDCRYVSFATLCKQPESITHVGFILVTDGVCLTHPFVSTSTEDSVSELCLDIPPPLLGLRLRSVPTSPRGPPVA